MKYTITIDQRRSVEWGLNLSDASVFALYTLAPTWATHEVIDGEVFYFVSRTKVAEELPILAGKVDSKGPKADTIYRINKKLHELGVIIYRRINKKDCIQLTELGKQWNSEINPSNNSEINPTYKYTSSLYVEQDSTSEGIEEVVTHLNAQTGRNFHTSAKITSSSIRARLREGFTVQDCKDVIDHRVALWGMSPKMRQYLRPVTLFQASKFEGYLEAAKEANQVNQIDELIDFELTEAQTHEYLDYRLHVKETYPKLFGAVKILSAAEYFGLMATYRGIEFKYTAREQAKKRERVHAYIEEQLEYGRQFVSTWHELLREYNVQNYKEAVPC